MCAEDYGISSAHVTFNGEEEWKRLSDMGFLQRAGIQYHWENPGYSSFDDFLSNLKQSKRKNIKQVGATAQLHRSPRQVAFRKSTGITLAILLWVHPAALAGTESRCLVWLEDSAAHWQ